MSENSGHRVRLIDKFEKAGLTGFHNYEVLEFLLTLVIPRKDTKSIAKTLLSEYKSISGVLAANPRDLEKIEGIGKRSVTLLKFIREISSYCLQENVSGKELISSQQDVEEYLKFHFSHLRNEYAALLFLDSQNRVMSSEVVAEGTVDHCTVYPRKLFDRAFMVGAAAIILVHNHPGGSVEPSEADWQLTHRVKKAGKLLDISLLDHIIITESSVVSLRAKVQW
jgi:DNA repair protein RadC